METVVTGRRTDRSISWVQDDEVCAGVGRPTIEPMANKDKNMKQKHWDAKKRRYEQISLTVLLDGLRGPGVS